MSARRSFKRRAGFVMAPVLIAWTLTVRAGTAPSADHEAMDPAAMSGMPAMSGMTHGQAGHGGHADGHERHGTMDHGAMDHGAMDHGGMDHGEADHGAMDDGPMDHGRMQGGPAPADARSGDYSDGLHPPPMIGMDMGMDDNASRLSVVINQLENAWGRGGGSTQAWEGYGWYGNDRDRLWIRSEGERRAGTVEDGMVEAFWSRAIATYWDAQAGVRHDLGAGPDRTWLAAGIQGLAPYWFHVEATAYAGPSGRTAARLKAEYELLLTQRLILQPEVELNLYDRADLQRGRGAGLAQASAGLRLRYEFTRKFAPYVGVNFERRRGVQDPRVATDRQLLVGVRLWF